MTPSEASRLRWHEDAVLFRETISFTAARTGFSGRLVEKDYFATIVIEYLSAVSSLVFKGGTCLSKVWSSFRRLSEDLDFTIPTPFMATRRERSGAATNLKQAMVELPRRLPGLRIVESVRGANASTHYSATVGYRSVLTGGSGVLLVEVGIREPLLQPAVLGLASTVLLDPVSGERLVPAIPVLCLSRTEAYAEKFRAALTRREAAIRDFFDIAVAVREGGLDPFDPELTRLVGLKLAVPGNGPVNLSEERLRELMRQLEPQLEPVLRVRDLEKFDLGEAIEIVRAVAEAARVERGPGVSGEPLS